MSKAAGNSRPHRSPKGPDVRISVSNFGPIERGSIDLRPMNIFVGPSNTGKTYFATLVYAIHRITKGFPRLPPIMNYVFYDVANFAETIQKVIESLDSKQGKFHFSDLPESVRNRVQSTLTDHGILAHDWEIELERCFDVDTLSELIQAQGESTGANIGLSIGEKGNPLWNFYMQVLGHGIRVDGKIEDFEIGHMLRRLEEKIEKVFSTGSLKGVVNNLHELFESNESDVYYLPSDRGGIMHSHRAIAISLLNRATRPNTRRHSEIPTFSGVMADFMRHIIAYEGPELRDEEPENELANIASELEGRVLGGRIEVVRAASRGYPDIVYRPRGMEKGMRLNRASSMVSEIAPVAFFIRSHVRAGDTVIIDEPEAHLHPAAQTEMAVALARLVRAGVRVVMTTHSEWLLQEIGNLMREGELGEGDGDSPSLRPRDVGVWLFKKKGSEGSVVEEIQFDRVEGIGPPDYEDVAESLYNRSADLQNRLAERAGGDEPEA